jgi:hypothetical protein
MSVTYTIKPTHIDMIRPGDTVVIGGELKTVCRNNIKRGGFHGTTLFGDSYKSGREPVKLAIIHHARPKVKA